MRDKINTFLNCLIRAFIGVFLARSVYTYWDYKTHPELYAVSSAPWYTTILLFGVVSAGIILAAFIVKLMIGKKLTFQNQIFLGVVLIAAANALAFIFHYGIFTNIQRGYEGKRNRAVRFCVCNRGCLCRPSIFWTCYYK